MCCLEFVAEEQSDLGDVLLGCDVPELDDSLVTHSDNDAAVVGVEIADGELALELLVRDGVGALVPDHGLAADVIELEFARVLLRGLAHLMSLDLLRE